MRWSEEVNEIATALAKAQAVLINPGKDSENPAFKAGGKVSKYAGLADALVILRKELSNVSVAILQAPRIDGETQVLDTRLVHSSGQWVGCEWPIGRLGMKQQELGSATTYARRYSLFSLVGIAGADDDDDGNEASKTTQSNGNIVSIQQGKKIGKTDLDLIRSGLAIIADPAYEQLILRHYKISLLADLPADEVSVVRGRINSRMEADKAKLAPAAE
jgi:ERF superfamily